MTFTLLDGGLGQELMARCGVEPTGLWSTKTMMDSPELVQAIHQDFFEAGADVVTTNTYAIQRDRLVPFDIEDQFVTLQLKACEIANRARDAHGSGLIAGSMGPTGASYRPDLALGVEQGAEIYAEIANIQAPHIDVFILETMSSLAQAQGALMGTKSFGKPVWLSISVDDDDGTKLRSGEDVKDIMSIAEKFGADALLINCSLPEAVTVAIESLGPQSMPLGAYANGFTKISDAFKQARPTVAALKARDDLGPVAYRAFAEQWHKSGARIIGGCCEVGPAHIAELARAFK